MLSWGSWRAASIICAKLFSRAWLYPCLHEYYLLARDCTLNCVSLGFHTNAQAIEAATRRTQCTEVLFTNDAWQKFSSLGVLVAQLVGRRFWRRWQTADGGSIPCWSASKPQDRRPGERQRARAKKNDRSSVRWQEYWRNLGDEGEAVRKHLTLHPLHRQLIEGHLSPSPTKTAASKLTTRRGPRQSW